MHRAFRRAWWTLAASAGLGLAVPAGARTIPAPAAPVVVDGPVNAAPAAEAGDPDRQRALAVEVELAWLADPLTFPYHLSARVEGGSLTVRGYVSREEVRERVLKVAGEHCPLPVADGLKIHEGLVVGSFGADSEHVMERAVAVLRTAFPRQAVNLALQHQGDGRLAVLGHVASLEEKCVVCRSLQAVAGCKAVASHLEVGMPAEKESALVQAPPAMKEPAPNEVVQASHQQPADELPAVRHRAESRPRPAGPPRTDMALAPAPTKPAIMPEPWKPAEVRPALAPAALALADTAKPIPMPREMSAMAEPTAPAVSPPPAPKPPTVAKKKHVNHCIGTFATADATATAASPPVARTAYVSSGTVAFEDAGPDPAASSRLLRIQQQLEKSCEGGVSDMQLVFQSPTNVLVRFKARDNGAGQKMAEKVLTMPELAAYHVDVKVKFQ